MTQAMGKDWGSLKKPSSNGGTQDIVRLRITKDQTRIRILGNVKPRYIRWLKNNEGQARSVECISFDPEREEFVSVKDPFNEIEVDDIQKKEMEPKFGYVVNVIDREDGKVKLFELKTTIFKALVDLARNPDLTVTA